MNIFQLADDPVTSAQLQHDKHVVKMTLETAQLISQAVRVRSDWLESFGDPTNRLYRVTHKNHPSAKWARENINNFKWLCEHGLALADEYKFRFWRTHKSRRIIELCSEFSETVYDDQPITPIPECMPVKYKTGDPVLSYRLYYVNEKIKPDSKWTDRRATLPDWLFEKAL